MGRLPKVIATSVIRSTHQGEGHGGVYIIDLENEKYEQVINWNDKNINWDGRGGERGLRGITFHGDRCFIAGSGQILVFDRNFNLLETYRNNYLSQCHEICVAGDSLLISSTGYDSIIEFNLSSNRFTKGYCLRRFDDGASVFELDPVSKSLTQRNPSKLLNGKKSLRQKLGQALRSLKYPMELNLFDPNSEKGPQPGDKYHINNVHFLNGVLYVSGTGFGSLMCIKDDRMFVYGEVPHGTHNVYPFKDGLLFNNTAGECVAYHNRKNKPIQQFSIKRYEDKQLLMSDLPRDYARQAFGRGLCLTDEGLIVGGSSPATISVYSLGCSSPLKTLNITMDVRNAIHGLEIWPF